MRIIRVAALGVLLAQPGLADTVTGEVIDLSCYLHHPETSKGSTHRKCAETCAKKGLPMGVLAEDGSVVLLLEDHANPKAYADAIAKAAQSITVEGTKVSQGGLPGIVVEGVK
jgi:hypothetical protein